MEASQTRDYCVAKDATHRAARPDPSRRKERLLRMTIEELTLRCKGGDRPKVPLPKERLGMLTFPPIRVF
jgi:hypothetical protein